MLNAIVEALLELSCGVTGHALLWALSLGRRKPFQGRDGLALFVGLAFWLLLGSGFTLLVMRP
jgi:hypothetical protein